MGWDGMDGMGWSVHFFSPISRKLLHNFSLLFQFPKIYVSAHLVEYLQKKIGMFFFSKYFAKINNHLFLENFFKDFSNFSKTTQYIFLVVFGPLRRVLKTSFGKKSVFLSKNFASFFFDEIWKIFKGISLIKTKVDFSR